MLMKSIISAAAVALVLSGLALLQPSPALKAAQDKEFEARLQKNQVDQRVAGGGNVPQHIRGVTTQDYERAVQELRDAN
jgi:hypothetical protein